MNQVSRSSGGDSTRWWSEDFPFYRCVATLNSVGTIGVLSLLLVAQSGCNALSQSIRERERIFAIDAARSQIRRGQFDEGLRSLDHAQASLDIGKYARESTAARSLCYERLGLTELARAHRRLLRDFYSTGPMAIPAPDGSSVFRVPGITAEDYAPPPSSFKVASPQYGRYGPRSKLAGRVVVSFGLSRDGTPTEIRVVEMPHPLLATWAIEALTRSQSQGLEGSSVWSEQHYIASFDFELSWGPEDDPGQD